MDYFIIGLWHTGFFFLACCCYLLFSMITVSYCYVTDKKPPYEGLYKAYLSTLVFGEKDCFFVLALSLWFVGSFAFICIWPIMDIFLVWAGLTYGIKYFYSKYRTQEETDELERT